MKMEKDNGTVRSVAKAVKMIATLLAVGSVFAVLGGLGLYAVMTLIFDKTSIAVTDLPSAFAADIAQGTRELPVARVFASYIPSFAGVVLSIFFFFQLRKTADRMEKHATFFYKGSHKELFKLAAIAFLTNLMQYIIYFGLKSSLSADTLPKNFGNAFLFISLALFIAAFLFQKREKADSSAGNIRYNGENPPEKE